MRGMAGWEEDDRTIIGNHPVAGDGGKASKRDRAYLIVLAGTQVGEMHKVGDNVVIGRGQDADLRIIDEQISRRHARVAIENGIIVVTDLGSSNGTYVNGRQITRHVLGDGDKIQIGTTTILKFTYHDDLDENFQKRMYDSALRDALTGVFNKRHFSERLETEFAHALRHRTPMSLVLFDIDHFKKINDQHGHLAGDHILASLAHEVAGRVRAGDFLARYGGEEFAVLCRGTSPAEAGTFAERIREGIANYEFYFAETRVRVTISIGVAAIPDPRIGSPQDLVAAADAALYEAKSRGRNCVIMARPEP